MAMLRPFTMKDMIVEERTGVKLHADHTRVDKTKFCFLVLHHGFAKEEAHEVLIPRGTDHWTVNYGHLALFLLVDLIHVMLEGFHKGRVFLHFLSEEVVVLHGRVLVGTMDIVTEFQIFIDL